jgi:hypothetical protein
MAMYTNIQPDVGIEAIAGWMQAYPQTVPKDIPQELHLQLLNIIMRRNVFSFDDTNWLQTIGTAMGTPCACSYATLSYDFHEVQHILEEFSEFLLILKRFIENVWDLDWWPWKEMGIQKGVRRFRTIKETTYFGPAPRPNPGLRGAIQNKEEPMQDWKEIYKNPDMLMNWKHMPKNDTEIE